MLPIMEKSERVCVVGDQCGKMCQAGYEQKGRIPQVLDFKCGFTDVVFKITPFMNI